MKQNNQGMTLIEVVAAFAILGFLSASIFSMILTGTKTYTRLTDTIKVQYDAQLASAKIEKQLLNCEDGIYWSQNQIATIEDNTVYAYSLDVAENVLYYGTGTVQWNGTARVTLQKLAENVKVMKVTDEEMEYEGLDGYVKCLRLQMEMERNGKISIVDKTIFLRNKPERRMLGLIFVYPRE